MIEYIARSTRNTKKYVVNTIGKEKLEHIYNLAEVYHSEPIEKVSLEIIDDCLINKGNYNRVYRVMPSFWDIGKVYQRLIVRISNDDRDYILKLIEVFNSWIVSYIDNYDSSMYYENPEYIYECYKAGEILS